jgi:hypothetical protein
MPRCSATKADGDECKANAKHGSLFCGVHHKKLIDAKTPAPVSTTTGLKPWPAPMSHGSDSATEDTAGVE